MAFDPDAFLADTAPAQDPNDTPATDAPEAAAPAEKFDPDAFLAQDTAAPQAGPALKVFNPDEFISASARRDAPPDPAHLVHPSVEKVSQELGNNDPFLPDGTPIAKDNVITKDFADQSMRCFL